MTFLALEGIRKVFGSTAAVEHLDLAVDQGEFLTLLGPSGCGKTTILRLIAGFEAPSAGRILLDGEEISGRGANQRPMGMVFQSYALFPHLTAQQNIAFGMQIQKQPRARIQQRCAELLELVGLGERGRQYPHQLSGGQQQRVALARALAIEPKVLLLDEPLSALDAQVRVALRNEIRRIQQQLKMTAIYVTHDQEEALAISDRIAVMARGRIEQLDYPQEVYRHPRTVFAATFVGQSNRFAGRLDEVGLVNTERVLLRVPSTTDQRVGEEVLVLVRPEAVSLRAQETEEWEQEQAGEENQLVGVIELRTFLGPFTRLHVRVDEQTVLVADLATQQAEAFAVAQGVRVCFPARACQVLSTQQPGAAPEAPAPSLVSAEEI